MKKNKTLDEIFGPYKAPVDGIYNISTTIVTYTATGEFEEVRNFNRKWWQFWKPKIIIQEIYRANEPVKTHKQVFLKAGEEVKS